MCGQPPVASRSLAPRLRRAVRQKAFEDSGRSDPHQSATREGRDCPDHDENQPRRGGDCDCVGLRNAVNVAADGAHAKDTGDRAKSDRGEPDLENAPDHDAQDTVVSRPDGQSHCQRLPGLRNGLARAAIDSGRRQKHRYRADKERNASYVPQRFRIEGYIHIQVTGFFNGLAGLVVE